MSIQYNVPGFELTTLEHESPPITTRPGLPPTHKPCLVGTKQFLPSSNQISTNKNTKSCHFRMQCF